MSALWICDVNGVLVDTARLAGHAFAATAEHFRFPFSECHFQMVKSLWLLEAYRVLDPGQDPFVRRAFHLHSIRDRLRDVRAYPGVREMLALARAQNIHVAAATSHGEIAEACLVNTGLYPLIDFLVTQEEVKRPKPDPDVILRVLVLSNMDSHDPDFERVIYVGDTTADIQAGKAAGVRTVGVTYGLSDEPEIRMAAPDYVIHSFSDMRSFLGRSMYQPVA